MNAQAKTVDAPVGTKRWAARLTASRVASALGLSKWCGPDLLAKRYWGEEPWPETNDAMRRGTILEPVLVRLYERAIVPGSTITEAKHHIHPEHDWLGATPDRMVDDNAILECKTANDWAASDWGPDDSSEVPHYYIPQIQLQLACSGRQFADVAVLIGSESSLQILARMLESGADLDSVAAFAGELDFRRLVVERDDEYIATMIEELHVFWFDFVLAGRLPPNVKKLRDSGDIIEADTEAEGHIADLRDAAERRKQAERDYEAARERLCNIIGAASGVQSSVHGTVTWKKSSDTTKAVTDWEAVAVKVLERSGLSDEDWKAIVESETETKTKEGSRVFRAPRNWTR
jgi:putative phage-type endonuclease